MQKELWDIYDANKQLTEKTVYRGDAINKGEYHLVIHICYFNTHNQMLIQQRSPLKDTWSGLWDISVGGAVRSRETSQDAASRESKEEIGISHDFCNQLPNISLSFARGFDDIFLVKKDFDITDVRFEDLEVSDAKWASKKGIIELIQKGDFVPIHSVEFIEFAFKKITE